MMIPTIECHLIRVSSIWKDIGELQMRHAVNCTANVVSFIHTPFTLYKHFRRIDTGQRNEKA